MSEDINMRTGHAMKWITSAAPVLSVLALFTLHQSASADFQSGWEAYEKGEFSAAVREFGPLAEQGVAGAQINLGKMYAFGQGVTKNYAEAAKWFRRAAEKGNAKAQHNLSILSGGGWGVQRDRAEMAQWARRAAEQGHAAAQEKLGIFYSTGLFGHPKDLAEAVKWHRLAAEQGHANSQYRVAGMYFKGAGLPKSRTESLKWSRLAAENGHAKAQVKVGLECLLGEIVPKDKAKAREWFLKAADQAETGAVDALAKFSEDEKNLVEAYKWYALLAIRGNRKAEKRRDEIAGSLTPEDISMAQKGAREWAVKLKARKTEQMKKSQVLPERLIHASSEP